MRLWKSSEVILEWDNRKKQYYHETNVTFESRFIILFQALNFSFGFLQSLSTVLDIVNCCLLQCLLLSAVIIVFCKCFFGFWFGLFPALKLSQSPFVLKIQFNSSQFCTSFFLYISVNLFSQSFHFYPNLTLKQ